MIAAALALISISVLTTALLLSARQRRQRLEARLDRQPVLWKE